MFENPKNEYVATAKCGCIVGLIADLPGAEKDTAKEVANFIRRGCKVELLSRESEQFKVALASFGHHCQPEQPSLFTPSNTAYTGRAEVAAMLADSGIEITSVKPVYSRARR
jgi:hypothetical protein